MQGDEDISTISAVFRVAVGDGEENVFADKVLETGMVRVVVHSPDTWERVRSFKELEVTLGEKVFSLTGCEFRRRKGNGNELERRVKAIENRQGDMTEEYTRLQRRVDGVENKVDKGLEGLRENLLEVERRNEDIIIKFREAQERRDREYQKKLLDLNTTFELKLDRVYDRMVNQISRYLDNDDWKRPRDNKADQTRSGDKS